MVLVPSQNLTLRLTSLPNLLQCPQHVIRVHKQGDNTTPLLSAGVKTISYYPGKWERDGSSPQPKTLL